MAKQVELKATPRSEMGGGRPSRLRRQGFIPGVLYGGDQETIALSIERKSQESVVEDLHENQILRLTLRGEKKAPAHLVIIKELQRHYLNYEMLHIDFQEISLDEKLISTVPVEDVGEAIGVTRDGGILEHVLREIEIRCLPHQIPETIAVDVSGLEIGDSVHVGDISLGEGVEILTEPELIVLTVTAPRIEEEVVAAVEEEEEAEAEEAEKEKAEAAEEEAGGPKSGESGGKEK